MEIKWSNVAFLALVVFTVAWVVRAQESVFAFLSRLGQMGPQHPSDERFWGLVVFSLLAMVIVSLTKIFVDNRNRS